MKTDKKQINLKILLAEHKTVSEEVLLYLRESMRCFVYAAILLAIYLGWGSGADENISQLTKYIPFGLVLLALYFSSIYYFKLSAGHYRSILEDKINHQAGNEELMAYNSKYTEQVQSKGFLRVGWRKKMILPTPVVSFFLIFVIVIAGIIVFEFSLLAEKIIIYALFVLGILMVIYALVGYPRILKKYMYRE